MPTNFDFCQSAQRVLRLELQAIEGLFKTLDEQFTKACQMLFDCQGKVVVMGMGKSGHIGCKMAASFASTGTPAFLFIRVKPATATWG